MYVKCCCCTCLSKQRCLLVRMRTSRNRDRDSDRVHEALQDSSSAAATSMTPSWPNSAIAARNPAGPPPASPAGPHPAMPPSMPRTVVAGSPPGTVGGMSGDSRLLATWHGGGRNSGGHAWAPTGSWTPGMGMPGSWTAGQGSPWQGSPPWAAGTPRQPHMHMPPGFERSIDV